MAESQTVDLEEVMKAAWTRKVPRTHKFYCPNPRGERQSFQLDEALWRPVAYGHGMQVLKRWEGDCPCCGSVALVISESRECAGEFSVQTLACHEQLTKFSPTLPGMP